MRKSYNRPIIKIVILEDCDIVTDSISMNAYNETVTPTPDGEPDKTDWYGKQW